MALTDQQTEYRGVYLRSGHWRTMRALALKDAEHRCAICNARKNLDVHHRTYERLGSERLTDLLVLCRACHDLFHKNGRVAQPRSQKKRKSQDLSRRPKKTVVDLGPQNERLHLIQQRNKQRQRAVREGTVSPALRAEWIGRYRL